MGVAERGLLTEGKGFHPVTHLFHRVSISCLKSPPSHCGELVVRDQGWVELAGPREAGVGEVWILGSSGVCDTQIFLL